MEKNKIDIVDTHSEEWQYIVNFSDKHLIVLDCLLIVLILLGGIACCIFVKCPDYIEIPIQISHTNSIRNVYATSSGIIEKMYIFDGQKVKANENILSIITKDGHKEYISSPTNGTVIYIGIRSEKQTVETGIWLFSIVPDSLGNAISSVLIPYKDAVHLSRGMKCTVKLDADDSIVNAYIEYVSNFFIDADKCLVKISFQDINRNENMNKRIQLTGILTITTKERHLGDLILQPFKKMLNK